MVTAAELARVPVRVAALWKVTYAWEGSHDVLVWT